MRRNISQRERVALFQSAGGVCAICQLRITPGIGFDVDHITPLEMGGEDDTPNFQIVCRPCHRIKTRGDVGTIRKAQRREAKHIGARKPPSFKGWRKFNGEPVRNPKA